MYTLTQASIENLLGSNENRYFSNGFRFYNMELTNLDINKSDIQGNVCFLYTGPPRPRGEKIHIGSIELLALSLRISTLALNRFAKINIEDTDRAFIRNYKLNVNTSLNVGEYLFQCKIIKTTPDFSSLQGYISILEITISCSAKILLEIDHRGYSRYKNLPESEIIPIEFEQLHSIGYKSTRIDFEPANIDLESNIIKVGFQYRHLYKENAFTGIGSARNNLLSTDAIRVFGQLMQSLLYTLENTDRERCNNIWLRKLSLFQERPEYKNRISSFLKFDEVREVAYKNNNWKLLSLSGQVGNYNGTFEVAYLR